MKRVIQVKVRPNARESRLEPPADGTVWQARLKSPPVDGKANQELLGLVARHFGCRRDRVSLKRGGAGRLKWVQIEDG